MLPLFLWQTDRQTVSYCILMYHCFYERWWTIQQKWQFSLTHDESELANKNEHVWLQGKILLGTKENDILEISEKNGTIQTLVAGHAEGEVWGLDTHPSLPRFITASFDGTIRVWDLNNKVSYLHLLVIYLKNDLLSLINTIRIFLLHFRCNKQIRRIVVPCSAAYLTLK